MKTIISIFTTLLLSSNAMAISLLPKINHQYTKVVVRSIPSFQVTTQNQAIKYVPVVQKIALDLDMDAKLIISILWTESHFKPNAKSQVGAQGLMQIMPKTRKALIKEMPNFNLMTTKYLESGLTYAEIEDLLLGSYYLKKLITRFKSTELAIVAYNMGPSWVSRKIAQRFKVGSKNNYLDKVKFKMNIIASAE